MLNFILEKFWNALSHKGVLSFTIFISSINVCMTWLLYILFTEIKEYFINDVAFWISICFMLGILTMTYFSIKKSESLILKDIKKEFKKELCGCTFFVSVSLFILLLEFQKVEIEFLSIVKLHTIILSVLTLIILYFEFSSIVLNSQIKKIMNDKTFINRIKEQEDNGYIIISKEDVTEEFLLQLDLGVYKTLNKKNVLNMKHGEKESFTIPKYTLIIFNKLKSDTKEV